MKHGKHLDGREITDEEMRDYEIKLQNHIAYYEGKRQDMEMVLEMVMKHGIEKTREIYNKVINESLSMEAPNKPGYYRANND